MKTGNIINFEAAKKLRNKNISNDLANIKNSSDYLLGGYRHLDAANDKERQITVIDNNVYLMQLQTKQLQEEKNINLVKAAANLCNAANRGCKQAEIELKKNFPVSYEDYKEQKEDKA